MDLPKKLEKALNDQVAMEFSAAYQYLATSAYLTGQNLPGLAHWMAVQHEEEVGHARKFYAFILERAGSVDLRPIEQPTDRFKSPLAAFEAALESERNVTASIHSLYELATKEKDYASLPLLQWFISEQVEEEASVSQIVDHLKRVADDAAGLLAIDRRLGERQAG